MSAHVYKTRWSENKERKERIKLVVMGKAAVCQRLIEAAAQEETPSIYTEEPKRTEN